ncbi:hypothetical protein [Niabella beijingensis]|uniref:hypothetical protein n=1 Tax=Niabella beijingensis TaxID=2872700 RepID=UPI001CBD39A3|nr:hypothetical protein [Niabella beijingensis]MBZ4191145.1 hypothetical protein [Niabella beijingensis]
MKKTITKLLLIVAISAFSNCTKSNTHRDALAGEAPADTVQLTKYLSDVLGVAQSSIEIDQTTNEFYVPGTIFRMKIEKIQEQYDEANIYKLTHEN